MDRPAAAMSPMDWAMRPLRRYARFSGRAPRAEYWWFYLATTVASWIAALIDKAVGEGEVFGSILSFAVMLPWISVSVRRLHDVNRTGWWLMGLLLPLASLVAVVGYSVAMGGEELSGIPWWGWSFGVAALVGGIILFVFSVTEGTKGPNDYGADPYGPDHLEEVFA